LSSNANVSITNAAISFQLNGTTAGTTYDQLLVGGNLSLSGTADNLVLSLGYTPTVTDTFTLAGVTGTTTGVFEQLNGVATTLSEGSSFALGGNTFQISYAGGLGSDVTLLVTAVPEPSTWALLGTGLSVLTIFRRRQRR
jgi:hypothetical protein